MKDLDIRPEILKLLKEDTGTKFHGIEFGKDFLDMTHKLEATKIDKWDLVKLKNCAAKGSSQ